jgi:vancomycin resistance protein YoaR
VHPASSLFFGLFGGAALAATGWAALVPPPPASLFLNGYEYPIASLDSQSFAREVEAAVRVRTEQLLAEEVHISADELVLATSAGEIGYSVDQEMAVAHALAGLRQSHVGPGDRFGVWLMRRFSRERDTFSMDLRPALDEGAAELRLERLSRHFEREAVDAQMLIAEHRIIPSREGRTLSVAATVVRMKAAGFEDATLIEAALLRVPPRVTEDDLAPVDVTQVLAQYETSFRGKAGPRAVNIRNAGRFLDGAIILPGETLSFNDQVGRRIHGRGFVDAPVIVNDEMEDDVGGGVCQVATTLHAAAVFGNLEIVNRRSHSRPSGYAPLGLDATVIDGKVDLKIRNSYDEPILVHVSFPEAYVIRVELLGRAPDAKVEHAYSVTHREPFARRIWRKEEAPPGAFALKQKGSEGMDVVSVLRVRHKDGRLESRSYRSKYYPVPEVFWLGEGAPFSSLPELPKEAAGVVLDGEELMAASRHPGPEDVPTMDEADGSDQQRARSKQRPRDTN